ncbi:hypothetical protein EVAR_50437_1 [Eumeta japonica]|uniref:Uncharacterized protein n=1 Tax=Eumeta variegata TaxID=151549 RepID=A0A4C1XUE6_EUMVA|nr:hypothetical protein EVAR_50437_1 [Eumeta japonica]
MRARTKREWMRKEKDEDRSRFSIQMGEERTKANSAIKICCTTSLPPVYPLRMLNALIDKSTTRDPIQIGAAAPNECPTGPARTGVGGRRDTVAPVIYRPRRTP